MSIRPPYSVSNNAFPSSLNCHVSSNGTPIYNMNQNLGNIHNTFAPRTPVNPSQAFFSTNDYRKSGYTSTQQSVNASFRYPNSASTNFNRMPVSATPSSRFSTPVNQYYPPQPIKHHDQQNCDIKPVINQFERNCGISMSNYSKDFSYPVQNVGPATLAGTINYEGYPSNNCQNLNIPGSDANRTFNPYPRAAMSVTRDANNTVTLPDNNIVSVPGRMNNSEMFTGNTQSSQVVPAMLQSNSANFTLPQNYTFHMPPPVLQSDTTNTSILNNLTNTSHKKEMELSEFLTRFSHISEKKGSSITVPEFRSLFKASFTLITLLNESKRKLSKLVESDEAEWNVELQIASNLQKQLSEICSLMCLPAHLNAVMKKLKFIKKKRGLKKKMKLNRLSRRIKVEQNRKELNQEIDKYLDDIKEKILKQKREAEMKKEADYILLEVRKKIHEAKRTIEKLKVFEKLRSARQANAVQKGLHVLSDHNEKFVKKVSCLKETMLKQLADYEAEEKALKVMLETEQEGQLEEETQWKLKKIKTLQQKRKNHIKECLFGNSEDPVPTDSLFLFHKYHTSAVNSIENLVQIRHHWDIHIAEDGEAVPQQWVVPQPACNSSWEQYRICNK